MPEQDYSQTRECLIRALAALDQARLAIGRANLAPATSPDRVGAQIDAVQAMIAEASDEVAAARGACVLAARRNLRLCR